MVDAQKYVKCVKKYLKEENLIQKVDDLVLDLLLSDLEYLNKLNAQIERQPFTQNRYGAKIPNPMMKDKKDLENRILAIVKELGLSPAARKKIMADAEQSKSPLEDFVDNIDDETLLNHIDLFEVDGL